VEQAVHQYIANARLELTQLLQQSNNDSNKDDSNSNNNNSIKRKKRQQEELEARLQILNTFWEDFDDPGPVYDIVVFCSSSNGSTQLLRAVIDVTEQGGDALRSLPTLTDFHLEPHVVAVFGLVDQMKFGIHFYQNGQVVNLFCDVTPHGSHVANIATAAMVTSTSSTLSTQQQQQPPTISSDTFDDGDMTISSGLGSGVAPGAKLVSLKIGDTRLRGMETGTSLMRALIAAVHHKCHVLNISYGEGTSLPNTGRIIQMMEEVVWRHNILIVASAGNNGPALTSVGAPGGASHAILGVAAGVSQHMMKANYSMMVDDSDFNNNIGQGGEEEDEDVGKDEIVDTTYTWSAVGPMADGDWGVAVTAPGGATTRVPSWTLQKTMLMNGTSMSSPHATGCVALLLSACMAEGISFSAARIRRALINTAKPYPNLSVLQQGAGMIQVDRAWEYLQEHRDAVGEDVHFDVRVDKNNSMNGSRKPRGIYLRQQEETTARQKFGIVVDPQFPRVDANDLTDAEQERRIEFEMNFVLESTEPSWVKAPETFHLVNDSRSFAIQVDPVHLEPGVHTASVRALDASNLNRGAIFSVPITVIMTLPPMNVDCPHIFNFGQMQFEPNEVKRYFLVPPVGATWMDVTVRDCRDVRLTEESTSRLIVLHTVQLLPNHAYRDNETQKYLSLVPGQTVVTTVSVEGGVTIEVALARFWSALGKTKIDVSVEFHGIRPVPNHIRLHAGDMGAEVFLHSDFRDEWIRPSAKLTTWSTPLRPKSEGVISPVGDRLASDQRDVIPTQKKQIYQLVLNYEFTQEEKGSFTPRAPALQGVLYESAFESQIMLVFDGDKKYLGVADAWPDKITASKGTVTVRLQVRHDDPSMLEKLNDITIWIERQLDKEIELSVFGSRYDLQMGKPTISNKSLLQKGSVAGILFAGPPSSKLPVSCKAGDSIQGKAFFGSGEKILSGEGKRPRGFPFLFVVGPKMEQAASDTETQEPKDERTLEERLNEAVRDVKLEQLSKLTQKEKDDGKFEELFGQLEVEYPDHLPLFVAKLKHLDTDDKKAAEQLSRVIEAADVVIGKISDDELALHFGKLHDKENPREVQVSAPLA
jgi:tripeptidyl-peptidase-2